MPITIIRLVGKIMTKKEKIASLSEAMEVKKREDKTTFHCFSDNAPEELKDLFLEHYDVRDNDYKIFSTACDIMSELYAEASEKLSGQEPVDLEDAIYERASDTASVYTSDRLELLDNWNQDEIADHVRDLSVDIATATAYWYDKQVENACFIIKAWIDAK